MHINQEVFQQIQSECREAGATLVAVSKTKPTEAILELFQAGQLHFGENRVQELVEKADQLPPAIRWHQIGTLQTNKVKFITPFVHLIHSVDRVKVLKEINKQGKKEDRIISCLLQIHIAREQTKFGFEEQEIYQLLESGTLTNLSHVRFDGLMGMATFTDNQKQVREEFRGLRDLFEALQKDHFSADHFQTLSMGMSGDYRIALEEGSTMIRVGSLIFGARS